MFWRKKRDIAFLDLKCQVDGCDFTCNDFETLQRHKYKRHPGTKLTCKAAGCDFVCSDYVTLQRHIEWKHLS